MKILYAASEATPYAKSGGLALSLIHISEPTRRTPISYAVFCLKKKKITLIQISELTRLRHRQ